MWVEFGNPMSIQTNPRSNCEFRLWDNDPKSPAMKVFARRFLDEVKPEFHTMKIGDQRDIGDNCFIERVR